MLNNATHIILIKAKKEESKILDKIKRIYLPNIIFQTISDTKELSKKNPAYGKKIINNKDTLYVCQNQKCSLPITKFSDFTKALKI